MKGRIAIRILIIASLYAVLYFLYSLFSLTGSFEGLFSHWKSLVFLVTISVLTGFVLHFALSGLRGNLAENQAVPFITSGSVTVSCLLIFTTGAGFLYRYLFTGELSMDELKEEHPGFALQVLVLSVFSGIVISVFEHNLHSYKHLQGIRLATRRLQTQQVHLRYDSLRNQISPHFLFNSLNTISSLIYRDTETAEKFIRNLAAVYISVLDNYSRPLIPLETELRLVEHYSYLMQVRFEDAFTTRISPPPNTTGLFVPPLSIQMLLENAIKHNHMSREVPLEVEIFSSDGYLVVRNNFIGESGHVKIGDNLYEKPGSRGGIGLENIRNRYRLLCKEPVKISKDEFFTVSIPLLKNDKSEVIY